MRFQNLQLRAFGPFTDVTLDFSANPTGIQLIYGPNEAGKSTALRAVRGLLFGIPLHTPDSFLHDNQALRIGAELKRSTGEQLAFLRRKGRSNTLLDLEENPLEENALRPFLQGISDSLFTSAFGLSHDILVKGGQDLAEGKGEIGEILFGAGLGLANLHEVLVTLESEVEDLFKQRGQVQSLNKALSDFKSADKACRDSTLPSDEYLKLQNLLTQARNDAAGIQSTLSQKLAARSRLLRIEKAIPLIARLRRALEERQDLGNVPTLPPTFMERRIGAEKERDTADRACEALTQELHELDTQLVELVVPVPVVEQSAAIAELFEHLPVYQKAARDARDLEAQAKQHQQDMRAAFQRLPEPMLASGKPPRIDVAAKQRLLNLGNRAGTLENARATASQAHAQQTRQLEALTNQQANMAESRDTTDLQRVLRRAQRLGEIESRAEQLQASIARNERHIATALTQSTPAWEGTRDSFETASTPLRETIERHEAEFSGRKDVLKEAKRDADRARRAFRDLSDQLQVLQHGNPVPSEAELKHARSQRSTLWGFVRRAWLDREDVTEDASGLTGGRPLDTAFEDAIHEADGVADALWRDADRASQRGTLEHRLAQAEEESSAADEKVAQAEADLASFDEAWRALWASFPLVPLQPREMLAWLVKREEILGLIEQTQNDTAELSRVQVQFADEKAALRQGIADAGADLPSESVALQDLIDTAHDLITTNADLTAQHASLAQRIEDAREARLNAERQAQDAEAALANWRVEWAEAVIGLKMPANVTPEEVTAILSALDDYSLKAQEWASKQQRIEEIGEDASAFHEQVKELASKLDEALADLPVELAVRTLHEQLQAAKELQRDRQQKGERRDAKRAELAACALKKQAALDDLARLCAEARCEHPNQLPEAERAATALSALNETIIHLQQQLAEHAGGLSLEAFMEEVSAEDPDGISGRITDIEQEIGILEGGRDSARERIGELANELSRMNGASSAFEAAQRAESHVSEVNEIAWRYARLRIATAVLRQAMDRYRQSAQGPVLGRASNAFARITAGVFTELRTGFDERDKQVVQGVRLGNTLLGVDAMSEGTRDQLYLALRLGTLEHFLTQNEPMPLILDDILVNFDDERAAATLDVLTEVAQHTQVLFFTHHQHLIEIARNTLPANAFTLHRLDRQGMSLHSQTETVARRDV